MRGRFRHCARLFRLDCRLGILQSLPAFVVLAFATLAVLWLAYLEEASIEVNTSAFTFGDNVALLLAGQPPYEFRPGVLFVPPPFGVALCIHAHAVFGASVSHA